MKRFLTILLLCIGAVILALLLCLLNNPAKGGLLHNHNPYGLQSDSSQVYFMPSAQEYNDSMVAHIANARESIYLEMYDFGGEIAREDMELMRRKAREGVKVKVMIDGWGSKDEEWDFDAIRADGVEISYWDSLSKKEHMQDLFTNRFNWLILE